MQPQIFIDVKHRKTHHLRNSLLTIIFSITFVLLFFIAGKSGLFSPPIPTDPMVKGITSFQAPPAASPIQYKSNNQSTALAAIVKQQLQGTSGSYGIFIKDLKSGEVYKVNDHKIYWSASLYKLWVMAAVFDEVNNHRLSLDEELQDTIQDLNQVFNLGPDEAELDSGNLDLTVQEALNNMITISDNYSALLLTKRIKVSTIIKFLTNHNLYESKLGIDDSPPTTTPSDVALFFEKLYNKTLFDSKTTQKILDLLKLQKLNSKIPRLLPDIAVIAHKTGELGRYSHDAGIVYSPNNDYLFVIMTESDDTDAANNRISNLSDAVYQYFSTK